MARTIRHGGPSRSATRRTGRAPPAVGTRSAQRGSNGASLKHRARDAEGSADLRRYRPLAGSTGPRGPTARYATGPPQCREALRPVGPMDPGVPRALFLRSAPEIDFGLRANPAPLKQHGRRSVGCGQGWCSGGACSSLRSSPRKRGPSAKSKGLDARFRGHERKGPCPALAELVIGPRFAQTRWLGRNDSVDSAPMRHACKTKSTSLPKGSREQQLPAIATAFRPRRTPDRPRYRIDADLLRSGDPAARRRNTRRGS
jgi:hypothetical protein